MLTCKTTIFLLICRDITGQLCDSIDIFLLK